MRKIRNMRNMISAINKRNKNNNRLKLFSSKSGQSFNMLNYIFWRLLITAAVFFMVFFITSNAIKGTVDTDKIQDIIYITRILYSPNSINYADKEIGRVDAGIISATRFTTENLEKSFDLQKIKIAMKLELTNLEANEELKPVYVNEEWYNRWEPLAKKFEQYKKRQKFQYVLIEQEGKLYSGLLKITLVSVV